MNKEVLHEAVESVALIKEVIEKTRMSFVSFGKIFIYWGLLFIPYSILTFLFLINIEQMQNIAIQYPTLKYFSHPVIFALIAAIIYLSVSQQTPLIGLEKHLMKVWLLIIAMNIMPPKISVSTVSSAVDISSISIHVNNLSVLLFSLAIALIVTSLFTGYRQPMFVAGFYVGVSIINAYFSMPIFGGMVGSILYVLSLPLTFLYTGIFLKGQQVRGY